MTRKKAIEAAMVKWNAHRRKHFAVDVEDVLAEAAAARAYDLGRIAGLREAARLSGSARTWAAKIDALQCMKQRISALALRLKP